ncbi:MAG: hypothetical protein P8X55_01780 [Desulfosarcinaceae bacterium]
MGRLARKTLAHSPGLAILAAALAAPFIVVNQYHIDVLIFIGIYIILTLSLNLLNGYVGLLSIGHAAFYGIGAYASAKLTMDLHLPFILAMPGAASRTPHPGLAGGYPNGILLSDSPPGAGHPVQHAPPDPLPLRARPEVHPRKRAGGGGHGGSHHPL